MADDSEIEGFLAANTRRCSRLQVGGLRPSGDPLTTRFGGQPVGLPGQPWPRYRQPEYDGMTGTVGDAKDAAFICQLNLTEAPFVPAKLEGIELIAVYCGYDPPDRHGQFGGALPHPETVTIRSYPKASELVLLDPPTTAPEGWLRPFEARWDACDDQPNYDDPDLVLPTGLSLGDDRADAFTEALSNRYCSKIGGYFSSIQCEGAWGRGASDADFRFAFQIAEEDKAGLYWVDGGVLGVATAIGPDGRRLWAADIQFD